MERRSKRYTSFDVTMSSFYKIANILNVSELSTNSQPGDPIRHFMALREELLNSEYQRYLEVGRATQHLIEYLEMMETKEKLEPTKLNNLIKELNYLFKKYHELKITKNELLALRLIEDLFELALEEPTVNLNTSENERAYNRLETLQHMYFDGKITTKMLLQIIEDEFTRNFLVNEQSLYVNNVKRRIDEIHLEEILNPQSFEREQEAYEGTTIQKVQLTS